MVMIRLSILSNTILPSTALGETLFNEFNKIIQKHSDKSHGTVMIRDLVVNMLDF